MVSPRFLQTPLEYAQRKLKEKRRLRKLSKKDMRKEKEGRSAKSAGPSGLSRGSVGVKGIIDDDKEADIGEFDMRLIEKEENLKAKLLSG